ncbi:MAG: bifunctional alpha/beta hydrolase/OsmC family protein [Caulobacteraceae bacterium]
MTSRPFEFDSTAGYRLAGRLETPRSTPRGWAVMAHCFTCGKDSLAAVRIAQALAQAGIGVLRFDFAGLGSSRGDLADVSFVADRLDLIAAGQAMAQAGMAPSLLVGHSLGGAAVLAAAREIASVRAVATIGAPAEVSHVLQMFDPADLARIEANGEAEVLLAGRPFLIRKGFLDDLCSHDLLAHVAEMHLPLLIMHSPRDQTVGIENATRIFTAAHHPKSFVSLDDADHLLQRHADADYAAGMIASWATRYLPLLTPDLEAEEETMGVVATETRQGRFQVEIRTGHSRFLADEPESVGGLGSGPSPYDLLCAGLAACTCMTVRLYAERKQWPLERISTRVDHEKLKDAEPADRFTRIITLEGPLDDSQRERMLQIAERCPTDLTLVRGSEVQTLLG